MAERYQIYDQLGAGGVGAVFRAYDNELKRWVAIKRLMSAGETGGDAQVMAELRREADALASLRNPNIVTIFDVASDAGGLFIVMELLEGEDLADVVARGPLHYDDFKELASQTLEALLAAHQRHILHRDIKPENIKVERLPGGRMQSKIIDFGLARAGLAARKQTEDQAGTVMGSIFYMAPEQLTRAPVDERTDLYSLGCVFYEALSGRKAFDGESVAAVIDKHIAHDMIPLSLVAPHVPPWLGAWVLRLMALNPDDRPANAQQAIEEFRAWEKMSAAPAMMPWMPAGHVPPGGAYTQPLQPGYPVVPVEQEVYAQPVLEVVPVAEPIIEMAAHTTPLTRPAPAPYRPPQRAVASSRLQPVEDEPAPSRAKWLVLAGVGLLALGAGAWFLFGRADRAGGKAAAPAPSGPPKVRFQLPEERIFPPGDADISLHVVADVGTLTASGEPVGAGQPVLAWHDLSPLGEDNFLRAYNENRDFAPRRTFWPPAAAGAPGVKAGRSALDFRPQEGRPVALSMSDPAGETGVFPFGEVSPRGEKGLTLAVVFQADAGRLPMRLLTLSDGKTASLSLRMDAQRRLIAEFRNGGAIGSITSRDVDPAQPCQVLLTWQAASGATELRARDAAGRVFQAPGKVRAPAAALTRLDLGQVVDAKNDNAPPASQFAGYLAELLLYSSLLKPDQIQQLESKVLRDHYFQTPAAAPPKK